MVVAVDGLDEPTAGMEWLRVPARALRRAFGRMHCHRNTLAAAGCAFYATLALFPALTLLLSLYGLAFSLRGVEPQLGLLRDFVPAEAHTLIVREVHALVTRRHSALGLGAILGALVTLWSAGAGTRSMLAALTLAYEGDDTPGSWRLHLTGLAMTLGLLAAGTVALALLVALPALLAHLGIPHGMRGLLHSVSLGILATLLAASLAMLYGFGPPRRRGEVRVVWPGTMLATWLWLVASTAFSLYVIRLAGLDATYGPLGAAVGLMLWFYVSAYVTLLGAELNAALEFAAAPPVKPGR